MFSFSHYIGNILLKSGFNGNKISMFRQFSEEITNTTHYLDPLNKFRQLLEKRDYQGLSKVIVDLKRNKNPDLSLKLYEEMVKKGMNVSTKILSIELYNLRISGRYEDAVKLFNNLSKKSPSYPNPIICVEYLRSLVCLNNKEELNNSMIKILEKYPDSIILNEFFCLYLYQQGEYRKLYKYFQYLKHHSYHISANTLSTLILCSMKLNHNDYIPIIWNYHLSYQGRVNSKSFSLYISYLRHTNQYYEVLYHVHDSLKYNSKMLSYSILPPLLSVCHSINNYYIVKHVCDYLRNGGGEEGNNNKSNNNNKLVKIDNPKFRLFYIISSLYSESIINANINRIKELYDLAIHILPSFNDYSVLYVSTLRILQNKENSNNNNNNKYEIIYDLIDKIFQIKSYSDNGTNFLKFFDLCYRENNYEMIVNVYEYIQNKHKEYTFLPSVMTYIVLSYFHLGKKEDVEKILQLFELDINKNSKEHLYVSLGFSTLYHLLKDDKKCNEYLACCCRNHFPIHFQYGLLEGMLKTSGEMKDYGIFNGFVNSYLSIDSIYHSTEILNKIDGIYKSDYGGKTIPAYVNEKFENWKNYSKKCDGLLKVIKEEDKQE